jgi:hypothetical protein
MTESLEPLQQPDPDALVELAIVAEATATHPPGTPLDANGDPTGEPPTQPIAQPLPSADQNED